MTFDLIKNLESALGITPDVDFYTFCTSPEYLDLKGEVYDYWLRELNNCKEITELVITGSLGGGKSFISACYLAYRLHLLFKRKDLLKHLGLASGSEVSVLYFSTNMRTSKKSGYTYIKNIIDRCNWFKNNCPRDKNVESSIRFPNGFSIDPVSAEGHQLSLNIWGFILDEANFREGNVGVSSEYEEVYRISQQLIDRQLSRFMIGGKLNSLAIFVSSSAYESSFIEKRFEEAQNDKNKKAIRAVLYEICPWRYSGETFKVFIGMGEVEPMVIETEFNKKQIVELLGLEEKHIDSLIKRVPIELKEQFIKGDIYLAIQNHCGVPTSVKGTFFRNITSLNESYEKYKELEETSPYIGLGEPKIIISNGDNSKISDVINFNNFSFPERPHSIFLDLSVQGDSGGLSIVRFDGISEKRRMHTHVLTIEIIPPEYPNMTKISKVFDFILELSEYINIQAFGSDQYQSTQLRQDIAEALNLDDIRISIDSSDIPHLHWNHALADGRFIMQRIEKLDMEIKEAEHDRKRRRVVKRTGSSDDLFQSIVGAFFISDTIVADSVDMSYLQGRINIVGSNAYNKMLKLCGYIKT